MIDIVIGLFMGVLFVALLIFRRRKAQTITYAVAAIGVSAALNIGDAYVWLDGVAGGRNIFDLVANWLLMIGAFFLARGVAEAHEFNALSVRVLLGPTSLWIALGMMTLAFIYIDAPETSTRFMADYGDQVAAAAYSIVQYLYLGGVMVGMMCVSFVEAHASQGVLSASAWLVTTGAAIGVLLALDVIAMDFANVTGLDQVLVVFQGPYDVLRFLVFTVIGIGLVWPSVHRWLRRKSHAHKTPTHLASVTEIWPKVIHDQDHPPIEGSREKLLLSLIRHIREAMTREGRSLAVADEFALRAAELHLRNNPG